MEDKRSGRFVFGLYEFDCRADLLVKGGLRIKLQPKPRAVLRELLRRPGELVTRDRLREVLWPDGTFVDFDLGLNVAIKKLRDALCDSSDAPSYIETAPGEGYRFIAAVEYIAEAPPSPVLPQPAGIVGTGHGGDAAGTVRPGSLPFLTPAQSSWVLRVGTMASILIVVLLAVASYRWRRADFHRITVHQLTYNAIDTPVLDAAISPSGKLIAAADAHGISIEEISTGQSHRLTAPNAGPGTQVSWLPDSTGLLLCGGNGIWSVSLLGGDTKLHGPLRVMGWGGCGAAMSPDQTHIAFLDSDGMWVMGARGESPHRILAKTKDDRLGSPTWSPDSSRIAYSLHRQTPEGVRATIQTLDVDGSPLTATTISLGGTHVGPSRWAWLSDGRIMFSRPELPPYGYYNNLWEVRVDPHTGNQIGEARQLTDFPDFRFARITGSSDGNRVVFLRPMSLGAILAGDIDDNHRSIGPLREITNDEARNRPVAWSMEGTGLYIYSGRGRTSSLYQLQLAAHSTTAIDAPTMEWAQLVGGGKDVVYGIETPKRYTIYRRPLEGGPAEFVLNVEFELDFHCAILAETCVIVDNSGDKLRMSAFDVRTGERRDITTFPMTTSPSWSLSPDGTRLAVIGLDDPPSKKIDIFDLASGKLLRRVDVQTTGPLREVAWAGPRALVVSAGADGGGCDLVFADGDGSQHLLWHDPRGLGGLTVSPDGRHVAVSAGLNKVNAWMAENF